MSQQQSLVGLVCVCVQVELVPSAGASGDPNIRNWKGPTDFEPGVPAAGRDQCEWTGYQQLEPHKGHLCPVVPAAGVTEVLASVVGVNVSLLLPAMGQEWCLFPKQLLRALV